MDPKTKAEAEEMASARERSVLLWKNAEAGCRESVGRAQCKERAERQRAEAARLRTLAATLPE